LPGWPQTIPSTPYQFKGHPALGYVSGSRKRQIVLYYGHSSGQLPQPAGIKVYDYNGTLLYDYPTTHNTSPYPYRSNGVSISDINGDGKVELIFSYQLMEENPEVIYYYTDVFNRDGHVFTLDWGSSKTTTALPDLNADGYAEMITGCSDDTIRAYCAVTGDTLWKTGTGGSISSSPAVGDINPFEPGVEITFGNDVGEIWAILDDHGLQWFPWPRDVDGGVTVSPALADIDNAGGLDIVIGNIHPDYIHCYTSSGDTIAPYPLPVFGYASCPIIGDIDGDRRSEIILTSSDGYLHVWENKNSSVIPYALDWPQFHHDYQRTGVYGWMGDLRGGDANPQTFSTATTTAFTIKDTLRTKIKIYDSQGNIVKHLVNQILPPGTYTPTWFGKNDNYALLPDGVYFIEIKVKKESKVIKVEIDR
jgi:hypothetical protein